MTLYDSFVA